MPPSLYLSRVSGTTSLASIHTVHFGGPMHESPNRNPRSRKSQTWEVLGFFRKLYSEFLLNKT